jgi:hypothetical protein
MHRRFPHILTMRAASRNGVGVPINWSDGKFAENGARAFAEHLLDIATASLSSDVLSDEDRAELERHRKKLENSFREILKVIDDLEKTKPSVAFHGRICLWDIMASAFIIGSRGTVTDSAKNFLRAEIETETMATQARRARAGNRAKAEARNRTLDDAIKAEAEAQKKKLATSTEFADLIRCGVRARLGLKPDVAGWPSIGSIREAVAKRIKPAKASRTSRTSAKASRPSRWPWRQLAFFDYIAKPIRRVAAHFFGAVMSLTASPTKLLKPAAAAAYLNLSESTLAKSRMRGDGPRFVKLGGAVRYEIPDLDAYVARSVRRSTSSEGASEGWSIHAVLTKA